MRRYWLRLEAQNLSSFILDTQDLSTARGGSLALLGAVEAVDRLGSGVAGWEAVSTGASIGLWQFKAASDGEAEGLAERIRGALAGGEASASRNALVPARHGTFRVLAMPATGTDEDTQAFRADREALIAATRRRQLSSAGLVYPSEVGRSAEGTAVVCPIDHVRPIPPLDPSRPRTPSAVATSRSVGDRRRFGLNAKQGFYKRELFGNRDGKCVSTERERRDELRARVSETDAFAFQLPSISEEGLPANPDGLRLAPQLRGKVAVLYMDGNGFGSFQNEFVTTDGDGRKAIDRQRIFDRDVKALRRELLLDILDTIVLGKAPGVGPPCDEERTLRQDRHGAAQEVIRFETLLWGGDELMFVMPARFGWEVARLICEATAKWSIPVGGEPGKLTHAVGLVFCHDDAPISRIQGLARDLADHAKELTVKEFGGAKEDKAGRNHTFVVPVVLESFDHAGGDLSAFIDRRSPPVLRIAGLTGAEAETRKMQRDRAIAFSPGEISHLRDLALSAAGRTGTGLSRRRLRAIARAAYAEDGKEDSPSSPRRKRYGIEHLLEEAQAAQSDADGDADACIQQHLAALGRGRAFRALEEHWDYLLPLLDPADGRLAEAGA